MAETDSPLKRLFSTFVVDFAAWLFETEVHFAQPLNVELPAETLAADQVFQVTLANGSTVILHSEFQGRSSHEPPRWRMLEYMSRLAHTHRQPLYSVVFYIGHGTGARDTGMHQINGPDSLPTLSWRYRVIRLWQMAAAELLALGRPALLPLVGQTQMEAAETVLLEVVTRIHGVADTEARGRLLTALIALLPEEDMIAMVERLIDRDALLLDTPYLRRIREEGRVEGRVEGREGGREEGRVEGRVEGLHVGIREGQTTGILVARRRSILETLVWRFDPPASVYQDVERMLETLTDEAQLAVLLAAVIRTESVAAFQAVLRESGNRGKEL